MLLVVHIICITLKTNRPKAPAAQNRNVPATELLLLLTAKQPTAQKGFHFGELMKRYSDMQWKCIMSHTSQPWCVIFNSIHLSTLQSCPVLPMHPTVLSGKCCCCSVSAKILQEFSLREVIFRCNRLYTTPNVHGTAANVCDLWFFQKDMQLVQHSRIWTLDTDVSFNTLIHATHSLWYRHVCSNEQSSQSAAWLHFGMHSYIHFTKQLLFIAKQMKLIHDATKFKRQC